MGAEVEVGGKVHRPDHPCYELEMKRGDQPKRWRADFGAIYYFVNDCGDIDCTQECGVLMDNYRYKVGNQHPNVLAAEAYKAKLLSDNQQ